MTKQSVKITIAVMLLAITSMGIYSCKKEGMVVPPERAFFVGSASGNYDVNSPNMTFKIPVGVTTVAQVDRTVNIEVSSPTGAVAGTHYNVPTSIVIPAGKALDSLVVAAVYDQYLSGRKDVLTFNISGASTVQGASFNKTFTLNVKGPCFEGDINIDDFLGDYPKTFDIDLGNYGPYTTTVKSITPTGPTSATIVFGNFYDDGWNDLIFEFDWSDPANHSITYSGQGTGYDAGNLNPSYAGYEIYIYPPDTGSHGTFSWCEGSITINYKRCIPALGGCFESKLTTKASK